MISRTKIKSSRWDAVTTIGNKNKNLIIFIHGITGSKGREYWGRLGALLELDETFSEYDFAFWEYPTNIYFDVFILRYFNWNIIAPDLELLSDSLISDISVLEQKTRIYENIVLVGHSQGGILAFKFASKHIYTCNLPIRKIVALASPFEGSWLALFASLLKLRTNRQLNDLGSKRRMRSVLIRGLKACRAKEIRTIFGYSLQDQIVAHDESFELFDHKEIFSGPHNWMRSIKYGDDNYTRLSQNIKIM